MTAHSTMRMFVVRVGTLIGNFSVWWGFCTLPIYVVGFALLRQGRWSATLPTELPLIGLGLAMAGLTLSGGERRDSLPAMIGLAMNALPMALAVLLKTW